MNHIFFADYGRMREALVGRLAAPPTRDEMKKLLALINTCMEAGCIGVGVDLSRFPGGLVGKEELVEVARSLSRSGGKLAVVLRNRGRFLEDAVEEALDAASRSGVELELPDLRVGPAKYWGKMGWLEKRLARARESAAGLGASVIPYVAGCASLLDLLPCWALEGGTRGLTARLSNPAERKKIAQEVAHLSGGDGGDWGRIVLLHGKVFETLEELAARANKPPVDWLLERALLRAAEAEPAGTEERAVVYDTSEDNLERVLGWEWVSIGSGEPSRPLEDPRLKAPVHPKARAAILRFLCRHVVGKKRLTVEEAVRRMTSLPARKFGLLEKSGQRPGRGRLEPGAAADVVIFGADALREGASFKNPCGRPSGAEHVLVGGQFAVKDGKLTGVRAGAVLRRS